MTETNGSMTNTATREAILQEIHDRVVPTLEEKIITEEQVRRIIEETVKPMLESPEFVRKLKFKDSSKDSSALFGSKFARHGLSIGDIEYLYDMQSALSRSEPAKYKVSDELRNAFSSISNSVYMSEDTVRSTDQKAIDNLFPRIPAASFFGEDRELVKKGRWEETLAYQRAMDSLTRNTVGPTVSGFGQELMGANYVSELWAAARNESRVFYMINPFEMMQATEFLPVEADIPEMMFVPASIHPNNAAFPISRTGSNRIQVDAQKFVIHQVWPGEMEEDSIIPYIPFLRRQAVLSLNYYVDSAILNGDTTVATTGNINSDDAQPPANKYYTAFDGLRKVGLVDNTANSHDMSGALTWNQLTKPFARMIDLEYLHDWGHPTDMMDVVMVVDPSLADRIVQLTEVQTWNSRQGRPLIRGQIAEIVGHPIITFIKSPLTDADGKVTTATPTSNTRGTVTTFNVRGVVAGWRRRVMTETMRVPDTDQTKMVHSLRLGLSRYTPTGQASDIEFADVIYNIDIS